MTSEVETIDNPFAELSDEELEISEVSLLAQAGKRGETNDEEYERHYEYIRRIRKSLPSTHKQFTSRSKYSPEREAQQNEVLEELRATYNESIPAEGKALFIGGMPGSGKSTLLRVRPELFGGTYAETNPDLIKAGMIKHGLAPSVPGLLPLETDELIRYEAGVLDGKLLAELISQKKNVFIDRTMGSVQSIVKISETLREHGYGSIRGLFMDIEPEQGHQRITARHRLGLDSYLLSGVGNGERPVPGTAVKASRPKEGSPFRTANAAVFHELVSSGLFSDTPQVFDAMSGEEITLAALLVPNAE